MACRVSDAVTRTIHHRHRPSDRRMLHDQRRRTVEQKSYLVGYSGDTASAATLQRLLARLSRLDRRVGNVVSFILRYWATNNSEPFPNGEGRPEIRDVRPGFRDAWSEPWIPTPHWRVGTCAGARSRCASGAQSVGHAARERPARSRRGKD